MTTKDEWMKSRGAHVRVRNGSGYHTGKIKAARFVGSGAVWLSVEGLAGPAAARECELLPAASQPASPPSHPAPSPYPYPGAGP